MKHLELKKIVLIGASTGGPGQIKKIINSLPKLQSTSVIVAQHMVDGFMQSFASRLCDTCSNTVSVVEDNQGLLPNTIYIIESLTTLRINKDTLLFKKQTSLKDSYNPDINAIFNSFVNFTKDIEIMSVILTGIGDDGVEACKNLSLNGARCITESEASAIVDGMPSRVRAEVADVEVYNINEIIKIISEFCE